MNFLKFLVLTKSHDLELHSPNLWTWIACILSSLYIPSLLCEGRSDRGTYKSHNLLAFQHPLPFHCLIPATRVSSISSLGGLHRLSVPPQSPFNSPASLWNQADLGLACNSRWGGTAGVPRASSSFSVLSTHRLRSQAATSPAGGQHNTGQSSAKSSLMSAHTFIWLITLRSGPLGISSLSCNTHYFECNNSEVCSPKHSTFI